MKQSVSGSVVTDEEVEEEMSEHIWETFDGLFKTVHRQGRRVEELEARITELERRLAERTAATTANQPKQPTTAAISEMPTERAA